MDLRVSLPAALRFGNVFGTFGTNSSHSDRRPSRPTYLADVTDSE